MQKREREHGVGGAERQVLGGRVGVGGGIRGGWDRHRKGLTVRIRRGKRGWWKGEGGVA